MNDFLDVVKEVCEGGTFNTIINVFDMQKILWDAIDELMEVYPENADLLWYSFKSVGETEVFFRDMRIDLWRSHVYELLHRIGKGVTKEHLQYGTAAEAMLAISRASMAAPLRETYVAVMEKLFAQVITDDIIYSGGEWMNGAKFLKKEHEEVGFIPRGSYKDELEVEEAWTRKRIRNLRTINIPDKKELERLKARDVAQGNRTPWLKHETVGFQMEMFAEV